MSAWGGLRRSPIGAKERDRSKAEADQCRTFEDLLLTHGCDFWHCSVAQRSQAGWPDYAIFGRGWLAFVEIKARSTNTGKMGPVTTAQRRYEAAITEAGGEWRCFKLPDEWPEVHEWLYAKTGKRTQETVLP